MNTFKTVVEWGIIGLLVLLSVWAVAVALDRARLYRTITITSFTSRVRLEKELTQRLAIISTIAANAPYIGLLGTVLGIMLTFEALGSSGDMDVKTIMTGLALALKATAFGIGVAIPCVAMNNTLRRRVRELLAEYDEARGG